MLGPKIPLQRAKRLRADNVPKSASDPKRPASRIAAAMRPMIE